MHSLTVVSHINASPDTVWNTIGNPGTICDWHPAIAKSELNGADRLCTLANGAEVHERVEKVDRASRSYEYIITESPLPLASYRSTIRVEDEGEGASVVWSADFETDGAPAKDVAAMLTEVYQAGLTALRASL